MRLLFQHGGQTGITRLEHLADALASRPGMNSGDLFVSHCDGPILLKTDAELTRLINGGNLEHLANAIWTEATNTHWSRP